ncbi:MAG TPA: hypothetical protein ENN19_06405 [Chloroflexi bacterium]|nr:hypothetical protein [Chloroflexota bacterium]
MKTGLLWFDDDANKELEDKVMRAAAHYERKYGQAPTLCFVHPSALDGNGNGKGKGNGQSKCEMGGVEVRSGRTVLPNHFWLGVGEQGS